MPLYPPYAEQLAPHLADITSWLDAGVSIQDMVRMLRHRGIKSPYYEYYQGDEQNRVAASLRNYLDRRGLIPPVSVVTGKQLDKRARFIADFRRAWWHYQRLPGLGGGPGRVIDMGGTYNKWM